jgi:hypothetical protein
MNSSLLERPQHLLPALPAKPHGVLVLGPGSLTDWVEPALPYWRRLVLLHNLMQARLAPMDRRAASYKRKEPCMQFSGLALGRLSSRGD